MLRTVFTSAFICLSLSHASAAWRIKASTDRVTDMTTRTAWLAASKSESGTSAQLAMRCLDSDVIGGLYLEIVTSARFTRGRVALRYRVDGREPEMTYIQGRSDGYGVAFINQIDELRGAKRLRIEILPGNRAGMFYEFDVSGIDRVIADMRCRERRL